MIHCYYQKEYYVRLKKWKYDQSGGGTNFEVTHLLKRALFLNSKLLIKQRQIDVRIRNKRNGVYVLEGSYQK